MPPLGRELLWSDSERLDFRRWVAQLREKGSEQVSRGIQPRVEPETVCDRWLQGDLALHVTVRIRSRLADVDTAHFCADLQFAPPGGTREPRDDAVPKIADLESDFVGKHPDWLNRPVLVELCQVSQGRQRMEVPEPLRPEVWLAATNKCHVCAAHTRKHRPHISTELLSRLRDREVDRVLPLLREIRSAPSLDHCPGDVVKTRPVILNDCPKPEPPTDRHGGDRDGDGDQAVALRVVVGRGRYSVASLLAPGEGMQVFTESLSFSYRPTPFQPRAIERAVDLPTPP